MLRVLKIVAYIYSLPLKVWAFCLPRKFRL